MKKPKKSSDTTNYGVGIGGNVNTGGGDITGRDHIEIRSSGPTPDQLAAAFAPIYTRIERLEHLPKEDREDLQATTKEIQDEVAKGEKADETVLQRRLRSIGRMAPDILEVIISTIANPVLGLGVAARKIADKAAEESKPANQTSGRST